MKAKFSRNYGFILATELCYALRLFCIGLCPSSKILTSFDWQRITLINFFLFSVERTIYGTKNPNPVQIEKAKLTLREHERTLLDALDKLADVSDDEPPYETQHHYSHKKHPGNGQGMEAHCNLYRQIGGFHGYHSEAFGQTQSVRMGVPFLGVQGDEDTP
ncbi:hypothetical protein Patl1_23509 [Pistacia atlantica]|uniref:Uncharacterized protein n=1 Tax=Pistacia atlantica TaxID=434234 RepID=A0ACC0ZXA6_9ROSI|nr:hypothetical protein Patl1_23509 [Pistacia atlantica]